MLMRLCLLQTMHGTSTYSERDTRSQLVRANAVRGVPARDTKFPYSERSLRVRAQREQLHNGADQRGSSHPDAHDDRQSLVEPSQRHQKYTTATHDTTAAIPQHTTPARKR